MPCSLQAFPTFPKTWSRVLSCWLRSALIPTRRTGKPKKPSRESQHNMTNITPEIKEDEEFAPPPPMDTSHIERKWLDVAYATQSPAQKLDLYLPDQGDGPFPVIV